MVVFFFLQCNGGCTPCPMLVPSDGVHPSACSSSKPLHCTIRPARPSPKAMQVMHSCCIRAMSVLHCAACDGHTPRSPAVCVSARAFTIVHRLLSNCVSLHLGRRGGQVLTRWLTNLYNGRGMSRPSPISGGGSDPATLHNPSQWGGPYPLPPLQNGGGSEGT